MYRGTMASLACLRTSSAQQHGVMRGSATVVAAPAGMRSPLVSPRCPNSQQRTPAPCSAVSSKASLASAADITYTAARDTAVGTRRGSTYDDSYDSATPMSVVSGWERVEEDLGIDEGPGADPQEWEEMVSLLSFDGEEHKRVMRQMHGANARVEDMFASFDGDDFEAVMRAARSEIANDPASADESAQQQPHASAGDSSGDSLYQSVCALRTAAMAAEAAKKQSPALKKRRTPLDDKKSSDAWMLQVPCAVANNQHSATAATAASVADAANQGASKQPPGQHSASVKPVGSDAAARYSSKSTGLDSVSAAQLQLDAKAYVGMSCDSSSDGGQQEASSSVTPNRGSQRPAAAAAAGSNNIVSSRALGSKLSAGQHVVAAAAVHASQVRSAAAAATAVLDMAPVAAQLSPRLHPASSPAAATHMAGAQLQGRQPQQESTEQMSGVKTPAAATATAGQGRQWSSSNTRSLRRALARLHGPLETQ